MLRSYDEVAEAIRKMVIRGAPAIGVAAAMGIALGASQSVGTSVADLDDDLQYICDVMSKTRPTAVNLFWAIERMRATFQKNKQLNDVEKVKKTSPQIAQSENMVNHSFRITPPYSHIATPALSLPRVTTALLSA